MENTKGTRADCFFQTLLFVSGCVVFDVLPSMAGSDERAMGRDSLIIYKSWFVG